MGYGASHFCKNIREQGSWGEDCASVIRTDKTEFVATNDKTQDSTDVVSK